MALNIHVFIFSICRTVKEIVALLYSVICAVVLFASILSRFLYSFSPPCLRVYFGYS